MKATLTATIRWVVILIVLVGLPILAIPGVGRTLAEMLYGGKQESLPEIAPASLLDESPEVEESLHAQASYNQPGPLVQPPALISEAGLDNQSATPPPFSQQSAFSKSQEYPSTQSPRPLPPGEAADGGPDWKERVSAVKLQLERWGADYLLLETTGTGGYHFHCRMALAPQSGETQAFEATAVDPAEAAEQVLDQIAEWRAARRKRPGQ